MAMVLAPLLLAFLLLLARQAQQETDATKDQLLALARTLTEAVDRELDRGRTELQVMAASTAMETRNWADLHAFGARVARGSPGSLFALVDSSGQMLINTEVPVGQPLPNVWQVADDRREVTWQGKQLPVTTQNLTRTVFRTGHAAYSDLFYGVNVHRPMLALVEPVFEGKVVRYALALSFPPAVLKQVMSAMPPNFRAVVIDHAGLVIAASEGAAATLADRASPIPVAAGTTHGHYQITARDGQPVLGAYVVSPRSGFTVRVSIARDDTALLARAASRDWMVLVLAAVTAAALLATLLARRLARPLRSLGQVARDGRLPQGPDTGIIEIDALAAALRAGVQAEQQRHQEQLLRVSAERQEQLVKASEARLKQVLDQLFASVAVLDCEGRVLEVNAIQLSRAGVRRDDVIGAAFWDCWWWQHDHHAARRVRQAVSAAVAGESQRFDCQAQYRDGEVRSVDLQFAPVRDAQGRVTSVIASGVDVQERVEAMGALRDADRQKDEFLATLAHELRNPLAPIRTSVELLRRGESKQGVRERAVQIIERQAGHLAHIVDDLLDVSRISQGKVRLKREVLDLSALVHNTADSFEEQFRRAGIVFASQADRGVCVEGDATRLAQCIGNLLGNALKFTPRGGRVGLSLWLEGSRALIEVQDNGAGIAPANLERVFDLFAQEQRSGLHGHSGLGIGLALTRKLVELHGGRISAASAGTGQGSVFRIELPATAAAAPRPVEPSAAAGARSCRVLVVDDNRDAADSLGEVLSMSGYITTVAYDGHGALRAFEQNRSDVLLLDLGLPDMSGYEVCRQIRATAAPQPHVIALTGWGQERDVSATAEAGFDAHLVKPVDVPAVLATLARLLAGKDTGVPATN